MGDSPDRSAARGRMVLKGLALAPLGLAGPRLAHAHEERALSFRHTHTDERLRIVYFERGKYLPDSLARIDRLLRDFRTGDVHPIEPRLLDTVFALGAACGGGTFEIISGFRSSRTNALLRSTGGGGVAKQSLHMDGRAIDVRLVGCDTARLRDAAIALGRGGVGYYRASDFVHLDTGRPRAWG